MAMSPMLRNKGCMTCQTDGWRALYLRYVEGRSRLTPRMSCLLDGEALKLAIRRRCDIMLFEKKRPEWTGLGRQLVRIPRW